MEKEKLIIVGSSGHAKVVIDIVEKEDKYEIIGLIDDNRKVGDNTLGYPIIGNTSTLQNILRLNPEYKLFIAIGDNWNRCKILEHIISLVPGAEFISTIHPSAQIGKEVTIGKGAVIMAGAVINSCTSIGDFSIIYTNSSLDHDNNLGDFASLAPNAATGGNVSIGKFSAIGIGASIKHGVKIGINCVLGGGSVLLKECGDDELLYGIPAKMVRIREKGEKYL
jgi:sugar O-acyltransferase (sialic acid O-acetyltransferase NeuD family)